MITIGSGVTAVEAEGGYYAVSAGKELVINSPLGILSPVGGVNKDGYIYESDGSTRAKYAKIGKSAVTKYDLWVGSTQVTDTNKTDILGDGGKATFDPSTNALTLNNPTVSDSYEDFCVIYSDLDDLTVTGKAMFNRPDLVCAIQGNNLILSGDFSFTVDEYCVYAVEGITLNHCTLRMASATGNYALSCDGGDLLVYNSTVASNAMLYCFGGDIRSSSSRIDVSIESGSYGIRSEEGISFVNSNVTVSGAPKYGIVAENGHLTVSNSTVKAVGTEIGMSAKKTISISGSDTNILMRNGVVGILARANIVFNSSTGYVHAMGSARAIGSNGLELGSGLSVTDPSGNTLQQSGNNIVTSSGSTATDVIIKGSSDPSGSAAISGTVTSFLNDSDITSIQLLQNGNLVRTTTTTGGKYSLPAVAYGVYTLRVSKNHHVTREYTVNHTGGATTQDVKICPIGDISGDGKVTTKDYAMANAHAQKVTLLEGYALKCGDVLKNDGKVTTADAARINAAAQKVDPLW